MVAVCSALFVEFSDWAWPEFAYYVDYIRHNSTPFSPFGCGHEGHPEATVIKPDALHQSLDHEHAFGGFVVAFKVVAVTEVTTRDKHTICAVCECLEDEESVDTSGAHHADNPDVGRVLDTTSTGKVGTGIGTPVADDTLDLGLPDTGSPFRDSEISWS
jgi:hypothetical protein